jgi:hypothetical protein
VLFLRLREANRHLGQREIPVAGDDVGLQELRERCQWVRWKSWIDAYSRPIPRGAARAAFDLFAGEGVAGLRQVSNLAQRIRPVSALQKLDVFCTYGNYCSPNARARELCFAYLCSVVIRVSVLSPNVEFCDQYAPAREHGFAPGSQEKHFRTVRAKAKTLFPHSDSEKNSEKSKRWQVCMTGISEPAQSRQNGPQCPRLAM